MTTNRLLIVFDIDGTLTASSNVHQSALLQALHEFGFDEINTDWTSYKHFTDSWIFQENLHKQFQGYNFREEFTRFEALFDRAYREAVGNADMELLPGAQTCLTELSRAGIAYCFATGSLRSGAEHKLATFSGVTTIPLLSTSSEFMTREDIIKAAIERASHHYQTNNFQRIISVGDGIWDARTAAKLKIEFLGVATGERAEVLTAEGAIDVITDFQCDGWRPYLLSV